MRRPDFPPTLETALGYRFRESCLLQTALTHRSFAATHNERLEFLGDSVLNCAMADLLYATFPTATEGELSRLRANLVNQDALHRVAQILSLGEYLLLGEGEAQSGGRGRPSILADTLEAILGAIFLDSGFAEAATVVHHLFAAQVSSLTLGHASKDAKTRLQEWLQARHFPLPQYQLLEIRGMAHAQIFHISCQLAQPGLATEGEGASRRLAEQAAATAALAQLGENGQ
ncbi:MAG: ribonuclease III [Zoogloeaceae bacterium]|nr:ribonuclease III [Zoogloeaceae bacterium]